MKVLVINLDTATTRMAFQKEQLNQLGLTYERLAAVQIKDKTNESYVKYYATWQRPLSMAEVSCFFSHKMAWDKVIEADSPMLILEDDALLAKSVPNLLAELDKLTNVDYINLEARGINKKKQLANKATQCFGDTEMIRLYQGRSGAAGYIIWPSGAKKLLAKMANEGIAIADKFINSDYKLIAYQIEPAVIIQLDQCQLHGITPPIDVQTSIGARPKSVPISSRKFWVYSIKRIVGQFKIGFNQLQNSHRATLRDIAISGLFNKS
ncbi:MAG: glycosyl transferase family 25 [Congregibacter sp.]|jgi:glycosyl transferase family 25